MQDCIHIHIHIPTLDLAYLFNKIVGNAVEYFPIIFHIDTYILCFPHFVKQQVSGLTGLTDSKAVLSSMKINRTIQRRGHLRKKDKDDVEVLMLGNTVQYSQGYTIDVLVFLPLTASARSSSVCFHGGQPSRSTSARLLLL